MLTHKPRARGPGLVRGLIVAGARGRPEAQGWSGAGPGDTGLMTVRAMELVKTCDVILYDRLVGQGIVDQFPVGAEKVYVGRAVGDPTTHQKRTNEMMVRYARMGKSVLRLKGGDPFIFGRGGEEALFLAENGIKFEVISGVS